MPIFLTIVALVIFATGILTGIHLASHDYHQRHRR
jgi:hypothetical protein